MFTAAVLGLIALGISTSATAAPEANKAPEHSAITIDAGTPALQSTMKLG